MNRKALGAALAVTLLAAYFAPAPEDDVVAPAARATEGSQPDTGRRTLSVDERPEVLAIRPRDGVEDMSQVFSTNRWAQSKRRVTAAPEKIVAPEQKSTTAPVLPFRVLGRLEDEGVTRVFLFYNDQNLVARVGDIIAGNYRVVSVDNGVMTLIYIPLGLIQTLEVGPAT